MFEIIEESGTLEADRETVSRIITDFYSEYRIPDTSKVYIVVLNDEDISEYNRKLFGRDEPTDVISEFIPAEQFSGMNPLMLSVL